MNKPNPQTPEKRCYLCGSKEQLTRDHVPPKGLFPAPRPSNLQLVTIPCCFRCNNQASQDDEYFRLATSGLMNRNAQGDRAWKRVVESTLGSGRIKNWVEEVRDRIRPALVQTPGGMIEGCEIPISAEPVNRVLVRLTRGFLSLTHPKVEGAKLDFHITQLDQFRLNAIAISGVVDKFATFGIGDEVYRHWRGLDCNDERNGLWVHLFYGAAAWMVWHSAGDGRITLHGAKDFEQRLP